MSGAAFSSDRLCQSPENMHQSPSPIERDSAQDNSSEETLYPNIEHGGFEQEDTDFYGQSPQDASRCEETYPGDKVVDDETRYETFSEDTDPADENRTVNETFRAGFGEQGSNLDQTNNGNNHTSRDGIEADLYQRMAASGVAVSDFIVTWVNYEVAFGMSSAEEVFEQWATVDFDPCWPGDCLATPW